MDPMVQLLPWLVAGVLAGSSTTGAAAPDGTVTPEPSTDPAAPAAFSTEATPSTDPGAPSSASTPSTEATPAASSTEATPSTTTPAPAASSTEATPSITPPAASPKADRPPRTYPRLVIAGGPVVGPHALGNEECNPELGRCETKGSFLGVGAQVELRARLWRMIYAHARGLTVGNVSPNDRIHRGLWGAGAGVGLHGRRAFGRAEYLFLSTFGDNHFEPPFYDGEVASDEWGHHAGMLSVGFRQPLPHRLSAELWGGLVIGPRSVRRVPDIEPDERVLTTFLVGLDVSWDAWQ
jgi:hypothetical protein